MSHATAQSRFGCGELRQQEAGFDDEGAGRLAVDGRGNRRIELSLNDKYWFSDQHRKLRGTFCFFGTGEKGNQLELSVNESKCEGAGE